MSKRLSKYRKILIPLAVFFLLLQSCMRVVRLGTSSPDSSVQDVGTVVTPDYQIQPVDTVTPEIQISTPTETATPSPTETLLPQVTLTAIKGNLFIRRGPDLAFNPIGVLYENSTANALAHDVLSKWVQITIPNSDKTGWVSLQTIYSKIDGDLERLPEIKPTEWPVPAYLRNCTYHQMLIMPGAITLPSYLGRPDNEIWINPGSYTIFDLDVPKLPEVMTVEIREGSDVEIQHNGLGEKRVCP